MASLGLMLTSCCDCRVISFHPALMISFINGIMINAMIPNIGRTRSIKPNFHRSSFIEKYAVKYVATIAKQHPVTIEPLMRNCQSRLRKLIVKLRLNPMVAIMAMAIGHKVRSQHYCLFDLIKMIWALLHIDVFLPASMSMVFPTFIDHNLSTTCTKQSLKSHTAFIIPECKC